MKVLFILLLLVSLGQSFSLDFSSVTNGLAQLLEKPLKAYESAKELGSCATNAVRSSGKSVIDSISSGKVLKCPRSLDQLFKQVPAFASEFLQIYDHYSVIYKDMIESACNEKPEDVFLKASDVQILRVLNPFFDIFREIKKAPEMKDVYDQCSTMFETISQEANMQTETLTDSIKECFNH